MGKLNKKDLFAVHKHNIKNIMQKYAGDEDRVLDEITSYIMDRISQIIRKERQWSKKRVVEIQWKERNHAKARSNKC